MHHQRNLSIAISAALALSVLSGCSGNNVKQVASYQKKMGDVEFQKAAYHLTRTAKPQRVNIANDLEEAAKILGITQHPRTASRPISRPVIKRPLIRKVAYHPAANFQKKQKWQKSQRYSKPRAQAPTRYKVPPRGGSNMWQRINRGQRMGNHNYRYSVKRFIRHYASDTARLQRISKRAANYLSMVVPELERRNMPTELALLPFVESAYMNTARSHASAAGMWQFIPSTGRLYGLKQTRGYDGRMDSFEATRAALDYLQKLHREFRGDWFLALAAYNAGEGRVGRAIRENRRKGRPTDYWHLRLPKETREYVPRLLAYKEIIRHPERYGLRLPRASSQPSLVSIRVNKAIDLRKAAQRAGLPSYTLTAINPSYLHGITTPRLSQRVIVPLRHAGRLQHTINQMPSMRDSGYRYAKRYSKKRYKKSYKKSKRGKRIITHRVRSGETLYRIALRHGTTVKRIMRMNRLRSSHVKVGKRLRIASKRYSNKKRYS
ncbi:MAG: hypothetical protein DSZ29_03430 [Aquificaceae bacterium]|nr:MAG: hypothetical protein DSZ29_03430 [Aquificaceae bacterium]